MPLLGPTEALPTRPSRIIVAGTSGAGKTTMAARIASVLGIEHVEIDALFHGPGWVKRPSFEADVETFTAGPTWVTEWQFDAARPLLAERADLMVWLDLPRSSVMRNVILRTLRRHLHRRVCGTRTSSPRCGRYSPTGNRSSAGRGQRTLERLSASRPCIVASLLSSSFAFPTAEPGTTGSSVHSRRRCRLGGPNHDRHLDVGWFRSARHPFTWLMSRGVV